MDYEDDEIWWLEENENWQTGRDCYRKMMNANMAIRLNLSQKTFDVIKNRWGEDSINIPLDCLDAFLDMPHAPWTKHLERIKDYELKMVRK